jgi:hypothetical protein
MQIVLNSYKQTVAENVRTLVRTSEEAEWQKAILVAHSEEQLDIEKGRVAKTRQALLEDKVLIKELVTEREIFLVAIAELAENAAVLEDHNAGLHDENSVLVNLMKNVEDLSTRLERERGKVVTKHAVCCVCLEEEACFASQKCGHRCACEACSKKLEKCPICRTPVLNPPASGRSGTRSMTNYTSEGAGGWRRIWDAGAVSVSERYTLEKFLG